MNAIKAIVLTVPAHETELASDALWSLGVVAIEERPVDESTCELWTSLGDDSTEIVLALAALGDQWPHRFELVDPAVSETWREFAQPTIVDSEVVIYPAWQDRPATKVRHVIAIEPGATFGMGDHPTTVLTLRAMRPIIEQAPGLSVLDVGCGSGVLAVAACLFGAGSAVGIDISAACVPTTIENAALNGVTGRVSVSTTDLRLVAENYDLVVANILAPTLIELAEDLKRVLKPHGTIVISGILAANHAHVLQALEPLAVVSVAEMDVWVAVTLA